ncbi:sigma-70 family RNA polymerase sigma factor [Microlunatus lacustris]
MTEPGEVEAALADAHVREWAFVVAATVRVVRDLDLAEECVQEAYAAALRTWAGEGIPANPAAWLTTTARRRGIDAIRREQTLHAKLPLLVEPAAAVDDVALDQPVDSYPALQDERLRLVFLCCHPALAHEAQVALTLRLVCGLSTPDIARAFLVAETTMAARLTRAKKKIVGSRIAFRLPQAGELPARLEGVLGVVHLLFTTGHTAPSGPTLVRTDLVEAALQLARILRELMPDEPEVSGLLALLLATNARSATRVDGEGRPLRLEDQDRTLWDRPTIAEAHQLVMEALPDRRAGRYVLQAAIACQHAGALTPATTDWPQILALYDALLALWPSPVVALNRAVALAEVAGPATALSEVEALDRSGRLDGYHYLLAVRADLLHRLGRGSEAVDAYRQALELTGNDAERRFIEHRMVALGGTRPARPTTGARAGPRSVGRPAPTTHDHLTTHPTSEKRNPS